MAILGYKNSRQFVRAFGLAAWLETRGLAGWLEIATDGMDAAARQRIACEIGSHYAEAVSVHLAAGDAEHSAQATALAELGDPTEAALNFRKSNLTESEAKSMKWMEWTAAKPLFSFWALLLDGVPLAGAVLLFSHEFKYLRLLFESHFFARLVLVAYAGFRLIPRLLCARIKPSNCLRRELALSYGITGAALALFIAPIPYRQDHGVFGAFFGAYLFWFYGFRFNRGFQIWNKLRKMGDERNDPPPSKTTAC